LVIEEISIFNGWAAHSFSFLNSSCTYAQRIRIITLIWLDCSYWVLRSCSQRKLELHLYSIW